MAITIRERVGKALELLNEGLLPFVERELKAVHDKSWTGVAHETLGTKKRGKSGAIHWDTQALLTVMWDQWNTVFRNTLGPAERSLVAELRDIRNRWAHQNTFTSDDGYRALDRSSGCWRPFRQASRPTSLARSRPSCYARSLTRNGGTRSGRCCPSRGSRPATCPLGKTHSELTLWHALSGTDPAELAGMDQVLAEAGVDALPQNVRRVVLVGTKISPGNPSTKEDGTVVHTLWGEIAWQLGGKEGYEMVRADDKNATNPGNTLKELFSRANQFHEHDVIDEIIGRLRKEAASRGAFAKVHACVPGKDVSDDPEARLVILGPEYPHNKNQEASLARQETQAILDNRGSSPRNYRNSLVFLAPDTVRLKELMDAVRQHLAWTSIWNERAQLNLDNFQTKQAETKCRGANASPYRSP
ncbi:MAG: Swt1 family HEPN domain-containing protein [Patescibacteria group bacterium]|nr:Swt1 family HEPN domain-containing protein [Patescibacteria group bacterium]